MTCHVMSGYDMALRHLNWQFLSHNCHLERFCLDFWHIFTKNDCFYENVMSCHVISRHVIACHGTGTSQLLLPFMLMPYQKSFDGFIARKNQYVQPIWSNHVMSCHVKTGSRHNFLLRIRSNSERGCQIEPVCKFSCFQKKSPPKNINCLDYKSCSKTMERHDKG